VDTPLILNGVVEPVSHRMGEAAGVRTE